MFSPSNKQPARLAKLADSEEATRLMSLVEDEKDGYGKVLEAVTAPIGSEYYEFVDGLHLTNEQFCRLDALALGRIIDYGRAMLVLGMLVQAQFGAMRSKQPADDVERVINQVGQPSKDDKLLYEFLNLLMVLPDEEKGELKARLEAHVFDAEIQRMMATSQSHAVFEQNQMPSSVESHPN